MIVGKVLKAHGFNGVVKVEFYSDGIEEDDLEIDGKNYSIETLDFITSKSNSNALIKFKNIDSYESAASLVGKNICAQEEELLQNEIYWQDIVGMDVKSPEGESVAKVVKVEEFGAGLVLDTDKDFMISWDQVKGFSKNDKFLTLKYWPLF